MKLLQRKHYLFYKNSGIDAKDERLNPNGGAIALGHPLGMSEELEL